MCWSYDSSKAPLEVHNQGPLDKSFSIGLSGIQNLQSINDLLNADGRSVTWPQPQHRHLVLKHMCIKHRTLCMASSLQLPTWQTHSATDWEVCRHRSNEVHLT